MNNRNREQPVLRWRWWRRALAVVVQRRWRSAMVVLRDGAARVEKKKMWADSDEDLTPTVVRDCGGWWAGEWRWRLESV